MFKKIQNRVNYWVRLLMKILGWSWAIFIRRNKKTAYLFGAPNHSNLGDHAQTYCIENWVAQNHSGHEVFVFQQMHGRDLLIFNVLRKFIGKDDLLFCHSGYHMTDLYPLHKIYEKVITTFPDYPVVVFPQTINFSEDEELKRVVSVFDAHPNCTLLCRDEVSYAKAKEVFKMTKLLLYPDVVTSLVGCRDYSYARDGILFCMRNDKEAFYKPAQIEQLRVRFDGVKTVLSDTTIAIPGKEVIKKRDAILEETFDEYAHYKVLITDRYHGTIFSLISGTPVIVLGSTDHKLSSGVKWFPQDLFGEYIQFAEDLDQAYELAKKSIETSPKHPVPPYFKEHYYDLLLEKLGA